MTDQTIWYALGLAATILGVGGPIYGKIIAEGKKQILAEARDKDISEIKAAVTKLATTQADLMREVTDIKEHADLIEPMASKVDRVIAGSDVMHDLIRNNTSTMEKLDATLTTFMQVVARN